MFTSPKRLTHDFPQKFQSSSASHLLWSRHDLDMMFNDVLNEKKEFLDYKSVILK